VGIPNIAGALIALVLTDRWGRKPLLYVSFGFMTASLVVRSFLNPTPKKEMAVHSAGSGERERQHISHQLSLTAPF
jgi:MFS family permease